MNITSLLQRYAAGTTPSDVVNAVYDSIGEGPPGPVWISVVPRSAALERARALEAEGMRESLPLYGIPFAVKDNFDVEGLVTTAGCPKFGYQPWDTATVVARLLEAGAILIGKTNMDQFATGLVGTRTPYGACSSVFDENYISGGSSSGSAVAVAKNLVAFSLGTDTAGSGRVPAAFNNLVGLKPSRGLLSTSGVFPACRSLDCVSIFAHSCLDAHTVFSVARGFDPGDAWSRAPRTYQEAVRWSSKAFRFGVPAASQLKFFGDEAAKTLFELSVQRLEALGGIRVEIDYAPFSAAAELLYSGPWVAERAAALGPFLTEQPEAINSVVRRIISSASDYSALDCFGSVYKLRELCRVAMDEWAHMDVLLLPTTGTIYTHEAVAAEPVKLNTNLGFYTNFVNLMDLAAVAAPAGFRPNGLPFGVSFIGPRFTDQALLELADRFHGATCALPTPPLSLPACPEGYIEIAVVGAHLAGQPLNWQLTERGARLSLATRTDSNYRLYSLEGTVPPKPGLVRDEKFAGEGIEVEVWLMPEDAFGSFISLVPAPLTIGTVTLAGGRAVKCFLCEPAGLAGATEITSFGGWRAWRSKDAATSVK